MVGRLVYASMMIETGKLGSVLPGKFPALSIPTPTDPSESVPETFSELLARGIERVQELGDERDVLSLDLALGKPVELHQVMLAATKAQLALELLVELRNKLIEAYQEISRMPV
jgi:flagellar hook-basal body complex protein FliE